MECLKRRAHGRISSSNMCLSGHFPGRKGISLIQVLRRWRSILSPQEFLVLHQVPWFSPTIPHNYVCVCSWGQCWKWHRPPICMPPKPTLLCEWNVSWILRGWRCCSPVIRERKPNERSLRAAFWCQERLLVSRTETWQEKILFFPHFLSLPDNLCTFLNWKTVTPTCR